MHRDLIKAVALGLLWAAPAVRAQSVAAAAAAPVGAASASAAPAWKQVYENGQVVYYVDAGGLPKSGDEKVASLLEYKVPQVIGGAQVWSIVSHMRLRCDAQQMVTTDNTLYARKMGGGPAIESQPANDSWHAPQPDSLGGLVWREACGAR